MKRLLYAWCFMGILQPGIFADTIDVSNRAGLQSAVQKAKAGDTIKIAPGTYGGGLYVESINGEKNAPIRIQAKDPAARPIFEGQLHFSKCSWLEINGLHVRNSSSNGMNIDEGGPEFPPSEFIVVRNCLVENGRQGGNLDGIKLSGLKNYAILNCDVRNWSNGGSAIDQVGCHNGLIKGCLITHSGKSAATGIQIKGGCANIVVTGNTIKDVGQRGINLGGSTGEPYFRPAGKHTTEASQIFVVGNRFEGSLAPIAFTSSRDSVVAYNEILNPGKWILRILQEKPVPPYESCGNHQVHNNQVVFKRSVVRTDLNIGPHTRPETFQFKNNVWFASDDPRRSKPNLPSEEVGGTYGTKPAAINESEKNAFILECRKKAGIRF